jgi:hypothetical protein
LKNAFALGRDEYPLTLSEAHQLLLAYVPEQHATRRPAEQNNGRTGEEGERTGGNWRNAGRGRGRGRGGVGQVHTAYNLTQIENHFPNGIPQHFILLDRDSTVSIFNNPDLLHDIKTVPQPLYLETNGGGHQITHQMGTFATFGDVWYNPDSMANVLSLAQVRKVRRVTMDTDLQ